MSFKKLSDLLTDFRGSKQQLETLVKNMPRIAGSVAVKIVKDNWRIQGYDSGTGVTKWPDRTAATNELYDKRVWVKGSVYNSSRRLLEQTMALFNAVKYDLLAGKVRIGVDLSLVPYAQYVNEGVKDGSLGPHHIHTETPPRQYMPKPGEPPNPKIFAAIEKKVKYEADKALKVFKK